MKNISQKMGAEDKVVWYYLECHWLYRDFFFLICLKVLCSIFQGITVAT